MTRENYLGELTLIAAGDIALVIPLFIPMASRDQADNLLPIAQATPDSAKNAIPG